MNTTLIHLINIIQYRLEKSVFDSNDRYYDFNLGNESRSPHEILSHLVDVSSYGLSILNAPKPSNSENSDKEKIEENFMAMKSYLSNNEVNDEAIKKLINGPLSDTLTHVGQLALLRRLEGNPIEWENYTNADT